LVLRTDQARRWARGQRVRVEDYLRAQPDLAADSEVVLGLIDTEVDLCHQHGEAAALETYLGRFPDHAEALRGHFALHEALTSVSLQVVAAARVAEKPADDLPAALLLKVEAACVAFEQEWAAGRRPTLEDFLARAEPAAHGMLLVELLRIELAHRTLAGDMPQATDYRTRLPEDTQLIDAAFAALAGSKAVGLAAALRQQMWRRWRAGDRVRVEEYLQRYAALADHPGDVLLLIGDEIALREEHGESPNVTEYEQRFPEHGAALRQQFEVRQALRNDLQRALDEALSVSGPTPPLGRTVAMTSPQGRPAASPRPPTLDDVRGSEAELVLAAVPGYDILGVLGRGGMGIVYKARQLGLNRIVALKMVLHAQHANADDKRRFRAEAEAVARLHHPNIVQIYEISEHHGLPYFSLEYCAGGSLAEVLGGAALEARRAARLVETIARAVDAAHRAGIIHRDLKPPNVLLAEDGSPKITDFGLAKRIDGSTISTSGAVQGTPSYMAPEQASGLVHAIGPAADVYALGAVLYESLTGRPPFKGSSTLDTLLQVQNEEPVPVRSLQPKVPRDLETICHKCLQKDIRKRYASAAALGDDLKRFLGGEPIHARRVRSWERAAKWVRRRPAPAALIGVLALVGLALPVIAWQFGEQRAEQRRAEEKRQEQDRLEREKRFEQERAEVQALVARGQTAADGKDWGRAQELLKEALARVDADPRLEDLRGGARALLDQVQGRLAARAAHREFLRDRDDALFHATLASGENVQSNWRTARGKAEAALAAVGFSAEGRGALSHAFTPEEKEEITAGTYALLLMLAEAAAQREALGPALALLQRAEALGVSTRALHLRRARYLEAQGKGEAAKAERQQAKALEGRADLLPQDAFLVGLEMFSQGELAKATEEFRRALRRMPDDFWNHYFLGLCCVSSNKAEEAVTHFTICQKQQPKLVWVYLLRGFALGNINSYAAAEEDFAQALKFDLTDAARYVLLNNRGAMRLGRPEKGAWDDAVKDLLEAARLRPGQYQAFASLSEAYRHKEQLAEAQKYLDQAIIVARRQLADKEIQAPTLVLLYHTRAGLHLHRKDRAAAIDDLKEAARLAVKGPLAARALADRGRIHHLQKDWPAALDAYDAALRQDANQVEVYRRRGEVLLALERYADAIEAFDGYLAKKGPPSVAVYQGRGNACFRLGRNDEAITDFGLALAAGPADKDKATLHLSRGLLYLAVHAAGPALRDFQATLELSRTNPNAWLGAAQAHVMLHEPESAVAAAERAVAEQPKDAPLWLGASRVYAQSAALVAAGLNPDDKQLRLRDRYLLRAVELLRQALRRVDDGKRREYWRNNVEKDRALDSVRSLMSRSGIPNP
jgi:tetratricopeptide (TPR) repeat protein/tRNA A-37 threonylcarbamoyl transferase component Bud32